MKFSLSSNFAKSWECDKDAYTCFIALDKAYDQIPREKLWEVLRECGIDGRLLLAVKSLNLVFPLRLFVRVGRVKSQPFTAGFAHRQGCVLSQLLHMVLFKLELDWQSQASRRLCYCWKLQDQPFIFCR